METCLRFIPHFAILISCVYFALSVALLVTTDFGEQKNGRDIAIALTVLTGLPSLTVVAFIVGVVTGKVSLW